MSEPQEVWVFSERESLLPELIGGGRLLAGQMGASFTCLVSGPRAAAEGALKRGAGTVLWLGEPGDSRLVEDCLDTIHQLVLERKPVLFLFGASKRGKVLAGRLAARIGTSVLTDILTFEVENGAVIGNHLLFAGGARRAEKSTSGLTIATVGSGVFESAPLGGSPQGTIEEVAFVEPQVRMALCGRRQKPPVSVNLAAAKRVVCPGRGLAKQEDLGMINQLAAALKAEVGCSRPLAEGLNWLPRERYIGVSGALLKSDLYLAIGISGQAQHTVGITGCRVVAAINKDESASIFKQADYGIVGDLYEIVPALIKALQSR